MVSSIPLDRSARRAAHTFLFPFLILFLHVLVSPFKTQARLEAEIVLLRHQLSVLRQRVSLKPKLTVADRLLAFINAKSL
jgi:hypothetical protein